jgi:hypothetical protein
MYFHIPNSKKTFPEPIQAKQDHQIRSSISGTFKIVKKQNPIHNRATMPRRKKKKHGSAINTAVYRIAQVIYYNLKHRIFLIFQTKSSNK